MITDVEPVEKASTADPPAAITDPAGISSPATSAAGPDVGPTRLIAVLLGGPGGPSRPSRPSCPR